MGLNTISFFKNVTTVTTSEIVSVVNSKYLQLDISGTSNNFKINVYAQVIEEGEFLPLAIIGNSSFKIYNSINAKGFYRIDTSGILNVRLILEEISNGDLNCYGEIVKDGAGINVANGEVEGSVEFVGNEANGVYSVAKGFETVTLSDYSETSGYRTLTGVKGYYYYSIDFENRQITLTKEQGAAPTESFELPYSVGDLITIINGSKYEECTAITAINKNIITVESLPFTSVQEVTDFDHDDISLHVPAKPLLGEIVFGSYAVAEGENTVAIERASHAEGRETRAIGQYSHAEGRKTIAHYCAHAEGHTTKATGFQSHSEGYLTEASGDCAHAEGRSTKATGTYSHAEGYTTTASGNYSLATGHETVASGIRSHAEGYKSKAEGDAAHAEGSSTHAKGVASHAEGRVTYAEGQASHAEGNDTDALGLGAHAEGGSTLAKKNYDHAEGSSSVASGGSSHAEGSSSNASAEAAHSEGRNTIASGPASHAEGNYSNASGDYAHAEGNQTIASGFHSHSEGYATKAIGENSHAEGRGSVAEGGNSHAEGVETLASGAIAHAEGYKTTASGPRAHSEGISTQATATASHAEGQETIAGGNFSHVEGLYSEANGYCSHAEGGGTLASSSNQHVEGRYNIEDAENKYLHIAGNGSANSRSNAHTLDWDGNAWFAGKVLVGNTKQELATCETVDKKVAELVESAPETLNTLNELATALGNDPNFVTTIMNMLANKLNIDAGVENEGKFLKVVNGKATWVELTNAEEVAF